jgi:hypothetical protein
MEKNIKQKITLDRQVTYQIIVPGALSKGFNDWDSEMTIRVEKNRTDQPITTLTATVDQAGLLGLLRHLYSNGVPLISVICIDCV